MHRIRGVRSSLGVLASIGLCAALVAGCRGQPEPQSPPATAVEPTAPASPAVAEPSTVVDPTAATTPDRRPDWAAIRAAEAQCADCHPAIDEAWRTRNAMGRSMAPAHPVSPALSAPARVVHPVTGEAFTVAAHNQRLRFAEDDPKSPAPPRDAWWIIGSGAHTQSFVWRDAEAWRIAPLTWYRSKAGWDLTPGYAVGAHPGFDRRVNLECLTCHGDPVATRAGTDDAFVGEPLGAIGCSRCHGDARAHVEGQLAGNAAPLVVPTRLDPARSADVCGQCHLQGAVRVLRADRDWDHFMPGEALGETVAVFVRQTPGAGFGIASQAERLGRSACAQGDARARQCTTCHHPHPTQAVPDRSAACRDCHANGPHRCSGAATDDCAGCHMVKRGTSDIPHVAMTDHFIRRRPIDEQRPDADSGPLVWINRPAGVTDTIAKRLLGRAYAEAARSRVSTADRDAAIEHLTAALGAAPDDARAWADLASMHQLRGDLRAALRAYGEASRRAPDDTRIARARFDADLASGDLKAASQTLAVFSRRPDPGNQLAAARLALAAGQLDAFERAVAAYEAARPRSGAGYAMRAGVSTARLDLVATEALTAEAARRDPGEVQHWFNLCRLRATLGHLDAARAACERAKPLARGQAAIALVAGARARLALMAGDGARAAELAGAAISASPADAAYVLGRLALDAGRLDDAMALLDRAVTADPMLADGWAALAEGLRKQGKAELAARAAAQAQRLKGPAAPK